MKKFLAIFLALIMVFAVVAACNNDDPTPPAEVDPLPGGVNGEEGDDADLVNGDENYTDEAGPIIRVALVTHSPASILEDASFNQGAWDGVQRFAAENNIASDNIFWAQPNDGTVDARIELVENLINDRGAEVIVMPGFDWNHAAYDLQTYFPDTKFILLDTLPVSPDWSDFTIENNLVSISYAEEQSGFLAGYAAVMDGFRELGFLGGRAVDAVIRFGHGFILGAEHAAQELGLEPGDVTIKYHYTGTFAADPAIATTAGAWYAAGTEVIFVAGGRIFDSVIPAAEAAGTFMIGVDGDQSGLSEVVITSAMKDLAQSVADMLNDILNGTFKGGQALLYNAEGRGVGLPMATSRFNNFTQAQYDAIFELLANGTVTVSTSLEMDDILASITIVNVIEQ